MARLLLIAACCILAVVDVLQSVEGAPPANDCEKRCKANCLQQTKHRNRQLKPCEKKCEHTARACSDCTSPRNCLACLPGYSLQKKQCVGGGGPPKPPGPPCLNNLQILYTQFIVDEPADTIKEVHGKNNSFNFGFDGAVISWAVPVWQSSNDQAATGINVILSENKTAGYSDVAHGDDLKYYRYLDMVRDPNSPCISQIAMWRTASATDTPDSAGWQGYTTDINDKRGGDYLYLCWKYAAP